MSRHTSDFAANFVLLLFALFSIPLTVAVRGYVVMKLWGWHVLPSFPTLPALGVAGAIGLSFVVHVLTTNFSSTKTDAAKQYPAVGIFVGLFGNLLALFWGWLLYVVVY